MQNTRQQLSTGFHSVSGRRTAKSLAGAALLAAAVFLAGCQTQPEFRPLTSEVPPPPTFVTVPADPGCQATQASYALGRPVAQPLLEELLSRTGSSTVRTSAAGEPLPVPADPKRLNVEVDAQGRIAGARCG
jgi:hypothetical protein